MYKCNTFFQSVNGKYYAKNMYITFDQYYELSENERSFFTYCPDEKLNQKEENLV